jgi:hypothetical protein
MSFVRAAVSANLPPKQVIFNDPSHKEYDYWDLKLLKAYHFAEDFIRDGVPVWWDESDDVRFVAEKRISKSKAAVQAAEKSESGKDKQPPNGRYYVPVPEPMMGGKELPTFADWIEEQERKRGQKGIKKR